MSERSTLRLSPDDRRLVWDGVDRFGADGAGLRPWRLAPERAAVALSPALAAAGRQAAGVRFALHTDAHSLTVRLAVDHAGAKPIDVLVGDGPKPHPVRLPVTQGSNEARLVLPGEPVDVEVWLPHNAGVLLTGLVLQDAGFVQPTEPSFAVSWTAYGSSLTQSLAASGPSRTWSARVARRNGWRLRNLGLSGEAHLDQAVARAIRDSPADLITLELGINTYILTSFNARTLASAIGGFLATIRDAHPQTPIVVWGPFVSAAREDTVNAVGLTLRQVRRIVEGSVEQLIEDGDHALHLLDATSLVGAADAGLLMDGLHPSADGELVLADRIAAALAAVTAVAAADLPAPLSRA